MPLLIRRLYRLAVQDRSSRARLTPGALPIGHDKRVVDTVPDTLALPTTQIVVDRLPGREVMRQEPPCTAGPKGVEDGLDQLARGGLAGTAARLSLGDQGRNQGPLCVAQIGRVNAPSSLLYGPGVR